MRVAFFEHFPLSPRLAIGALVLLALLGGCDELDKVILDTTSTENVQHASTIEGGEDGEQPSQLAKLLERASYFFTLHVSSLIEDAPAAPRGKAIPVAFQAIAMPALPGWDRANIKPFLAALARHCKGHSRLSARYETRYLVWRKADWASICAQHDESPLTKTQLVQLFSAWQVTVGNSAQTPKRAGILTGYAEYHIKGSRTRTAHYRYPIHRKPADLVTVNRTRYKVTDTGRVTPYHTRADIFNGALDNRGLELLWFAHPLDVYISQIQSTAIISLRDGSQVRIGYGGDNGHAYTSLMRHMLRKGTLSKQSVNWDGVRTALDRATPQQALDTLAVNPRYIFFELRPYGAAGPTGAIPVPLTRRGSMAVDRAVYPLGTAFWINNGSVQQPVMAQDTGAAIKGALRGDLYLGSGHKDFAAAERTRHATEFYVLLPKGTYPLTEIPRY